MKVSTKKVLGLALVGVPAASSLTACDRGGTTATVVGIKTKATTAAGDAKAEGGAAADTTGTNNGEKKILHVAMRCAYTPYDWTQSDDSNGAVTIADSNEFAHGCDVMMTKKICEELGHGLKIMRLDWDSLILTVTTGQVDRVIAGQSITSEHLQAVDLTEPYYYTTTVTLVKEDSRYADARSVVDLTGATCISQQSTIWYNTCLPQVQDANILAVTASTPDVPISLDADKCDLVATDQPTDKGAPIAYPDFKMVEFGDGDANFQVTDEDTNVGISLKKGNAELKGAISNVLAKMTKSDFSKIVDEAISVQPPAN